MNKNRRTIEENEVAKFEDEILDLKAEIEKGKVNNSKGEETDG